MGIARSLLLKASKDRWLRDNLPRYKFAQQAVKRFMPGERVEDALKAMQQFRGEGIKGELTYLGENVTDRSQADQVGQQYRDVLGLIEKAGVDCEISVKLTQLGHDISPEVSYSNVKAILDTPAAVKGCVWIDMEDSSYVDSTLALYRRLRAEYPNVGVCLQAYLYRTAADLESLLPLEPSIRLVKGAYREPPDRAFPKKSDVDLNFLKLSIMLLNAMKVGKTRTGFGTHDTDLVAQIQEAAKKINLPKDRLEFQMLYGIRSEAMRSLVKAGHEGRILISYGPAWFAWYMRRLAERPANVLFVIKNLWS